VVFDAESGCLYEKDDAVNKWEDVFVSFDKSGNEGIGVANAEHPYRCPLSR
jgi:hypothetical protein